jgi:hypothetical protein
MVRTKGSRNRATIAAELQRQVDIQDEAHLNTKNNNVLSVISDAKEDSESEFESDYDDSDNDATFEPPIDQAMSEDVLAENGLTRKETTAPASQKKTQEASKASTSKAAESKSTHVTTLKVSNVKSGSDRVKKHTDVGAMITQNLDLFKAGIRVTNVHGLAERLQLTVNKIERSSNHILKLIAQVTTSVQRLSNFTKHIKLRGGLLE